MHKTHIDELIRRNRGDITLGTLFYYAYRFSGGTFTSSEISRNDFFYLTDKDISFYNPSNRRENNDT